MEDIFLKTNKVRLSLQGKQLAISVANNKMGAFQQKLEFGKLVSVIMSLTAFKYLKYFSNEIDLRPRDFFHGKASMKMGTEY